MRSFVRHLHITTMGRLRQIVRGISGSIILLVCLGPSLAAAEQTANAAPKPTVTFTRAVTPQSADELVLPGTIEAWQETLVYARTDGYVRQWHKDLGDRVKAGDLLLEIDAPEVDQAHAQAVANVAQARAKLEIARTTYDRWRALVTKQTVAKHDLDERRAVFESATADLAAATANVARLRKLQEFKLVTAPFGGIVTARHVEHGALIDAGSSGDKRELYRIAEVSKLKIRLQVPQAHLRAMQIGTTATVLVTEYPGQHFAGKIVRTAGAINPDSRTLLTELELPNIDGTLLPGLYAQVKFSLPHAVNTVLVPTNAVRIDATGGHIATVEKDDTIKMNAVSLGRNLGIQLEILSGLAPDSRVVLNPTDEMKDGLAVVPKEAVSPKP